MNLKNVSKRIAGTIKIGNIEDALRAFVTSQRMLNQGMCLCDECGELCSTDYRYCKQCEREVVIFEEKHMEKRNAAKRLKKNRDSKHIIHNG